MTQDDAAVEVETPVEPGSAVEAGLRVEPGTAPPKLGRKRDHSRDAEILQAAIDVLAETGYDGMTI